MSLHFRKEIEFAGTVAQVAAMLAAEEFRRAVAERAGADEIETTTTAGDDGAVVAEVAFRQSVDGLPGVVRRAVGGEVDVRQTETWTAPDRAGLEVVIPGKPGHIRGTITLTEADGRTTQLVDARIKVGVPLVGGQLETLLGRILGHVLKVQREVGNERLAAGS